MVALGYAAQIRAVVDDGDDALRLEVERWEPEARGGRASPRRGRLTLRPDLTSIQSDAREPVRDPRRRVGVPRLPNPSQPRERALAGRRTGASSCQPLRGA